MKKLLSCLIVIAQIVTVLPAIAFAEGDTSDVVTDANLIETYSGEETADDLKGKVSGLFLDESCSVLAYGVTKEYVDELAEAADGNTALEPYISAAYNLLGVSGYENIHEAITLSQRGKRETETTRTQVTYNIGGQYDITGYYVRPGETIGVYANYDPKGPVPKIVFATANQDHREWYKGFDGVNLKIGYNEITCTDMKGCQLIYFYNPALPENQAFPPKVRLAGGTEYPVYRYNSKNPEESESSKSFYERLEAYCKEVEDIDAEVEEGNGKYNVCELVSGRIVITTSAKGALKGLQVSTKFDRSQGASWEEGTEGRVYQGAKDVMELWEQMMREDYALYMGYNIDDPNHEEYEPRAAILWRAYTNGIGAGWAQNVFAAFNAYSLPDEDPWDNETFASFTDPRIILEAYWLQYHEIGHVYDNRLIGTAESTNNLYALMASMKYIGKSRMENENRWYNHFQTGINTGVFPDDDMIFYPAVAIFQLEAVDFSETALYPDIKSTYGRACRYARLHRSELESLPTKDDRLIVAISMGAGVDLSDHFAAIGHEISDQAHWLLKDLPKETRHIEFANGRTFHGGAFSDELRSTAPVINSAVAGDSTGAVVIKINDTTYIENGTDNNLQCFSVSRQDVTDENNPVPAKPEFVGITGDNLNTKGVNELYSFEDKDVMAGHKYKYVITAYDCTFAPATEDAEVEVKIPDEAVVPIYWIDINHGIGSGITADYDDDIKLQLNYRPFNTTYDLRNVKWEYDNKLIQLKDDPDYPGDPTRKVARALRAIPSGTNIVVRIGGKNDLGYGYNDNGTLKTGPSLTATYNITVTDSHIPIEEVSISESSLNMLNGEIVQLTAQALPADNTNANTLTWKSMDHNVAQVDIHGNVTAMGVGETDITASVTDSVSGKLFWATCHVTVRAADEPASIEIEPWEPTDENGYPILIAGEKNYRKMTLKAEPEGAVAHPDHITWKTVGATSDDPFWEPYANDFPPAGFDGIAELYGSGVLLGHGFYSGTVDIQAELETSSGIISSNVVRVAVKLSEDDLPTPKPTTPPEPTVPPEPTATPKATPTPVPTMIPNPLRNVTINHVDYTLNGVGSTIELELIPNPEGAADADKIIWRSSNSAVASVAKSEDDPKKATVTAVSPGTVTVSGIWNGKAAACRLTVNTDVALTGLQFSGQPENQAITKTMTEDDTYQFMLYPVPMNATGLSAAKWSSDNETVAEVDPSRGIVTALSPGTAVITGTVEQTINGETTQKTLTCTVTVKKKEIPLTGVSISEVNHSIKDSETFMLTLSPRPANANSGVTEISWESDNESVAVVNKDGVVTPKSDGTVTITGKMGKFSQSCQVVVEGISAIEPTPEPTEKPVRSLEIQDPDNNYEKVDYAVPIVLETKAFGYSDAAEKILSIKNTGNQPAKLIKNGLHGDIEVEITLPEDAEHEDSDKYLYPGKSAALTVRQKTGLSAGEHNGMVFISDENWRLFYSVKFNFTVNPLNVTISADGITKEYGETKTSADVNISLTADGDAPAELTAENLGITVTSEGFAPSAAVQPNPYPYTVRTDYSGGNYSITFDNAAEAGVTVNKAVPILQTVNATGIYSGDALSKSTLTARYKNPYTDEYVSGTLTWDNPDEVLKEESDNVSTVFLKEYTFTPADTNNYETAAGKAEVIVSDKLPSELSVSSGTPLTVEYDGTEKAVDFVSNREDAETVKYRPEGADDSAWTTTAPKNAGRYDVRAELPETDTYAAGSASAVLTINPRPVTLSYSLAELSKVYDGSTGIEAPAVAVGNKVNGDDVDINAENVSAVMADANAGNDKSVTVTVKSADNTLTGADAANYSIATDITFHTTANVSKRPVTLALNPDIIEKEYGKTYLFNNDDFTVGDNQLAEGETVADIHATLSSDGAAADAKAGLYDVFAVADGYSNYSVSTPSIGSIKVNRVAPETVSVSASSGLEGAALSEITITGTFRNPYSYAVIDGTLEWKNPAGTLTEGTNRYEWVFTPSDTENYVSSEGTAMVTATKRPPAPIEIKLPDNLEYDGNPKTAEAIAGVNGASSLVEYRLVDNAAPQNKEANEWTTAAPSDAGVYEVRATVYAYAEYAENSITQTMIITPAAPELNGEVTASTVDLGAYLSASVLDGTFIGVDGATVTGAFVWQWQGSDTPDSIIVEPDVEYGWIFVPDSANYKTVTGTIKVNITNRTAKAVVYNLPSDDYAYVTVDGENVKAGDIVTFYRDADLKDPISESVQISSDADGLFRIALDADALDKTAGTIYVKIAASTGVAAVSYKAELGFTLEPDSLSLKTGESRTLEITLSDSYNVLSPTWTINNEIAALSVLSSSAGWEVTGTAPGDALLTVTITFEHPDPLMAPIVITQTIPVNVYDDEIPQTGVYYEEMPTLSGDEVNAVIVNDSDESGALFAAAVYKNNAMVDIRLVTVSIGERLTVKGDIMRLNDDYISDSETQVRFFLWSVRNMQPYSEAISGK